jgi:deoxyribose-phosphate aldolase
MTQNAPLSPSQLAHYIDHTLLRPDADDASLQKLCHEAREYGFYSVCVYWHQIQKVAALLSGSSVLPIAVVGFPGGEVPTEEKVQETRHAIQNGAREIDMVLKRSALLSGHPAEAETDIAAVVQAAGNTLVKVILENSELTPEQKRLACQLAKKAGAQFVKTSTGFSKSGATAEDVALMRAEVGPKMGVKASGGIRSYETALKMIQAGATRLGTSASVEIVQGAAAKREGY